MKRLLWSSLLLWIAGPIALFASAYRPFTGSGGVASSLPTTIGVFRMIADKTITSRQHALLGTDDAVQRTYVDALGARVFLVCVFHRENWKSIHPPDICLRGSNMEIIGDRQLDDAGVLLTHSRDRGRDYLSLYRYGGAELATGSYFEFFVHHAPRALLRASETGYLIRVETWVGADGEGAAMARCRAFLDAATPELTRLSR